MEHACAQQRRLHACSHGNFSVWPISWACQRAKHLQVYRLLYMSSPTGSNVQSSKECRPECVCVCSKAQWK